MSPNKNDMVIHKFTVAPLYSRDQKRERKRRKQNQQHIHSVTSDQRKCQVTNRIIIYQLQPLRTFQFSNVILYWPMRFTRSHFFFFFYRFVLRVNIRLRMYWEIKVETKNFSMLLNTSNSKIYTHLCRICIIFMWIDIKTCEKKMYS